jgi:hypothetical protein
VGISQGVLTGIGSSWENPLTGDEKVGYTENWDFDIQRQMPFGLLFDAAYVGSHGVHLNQSGESDYNVDQLTPAALALGSQLQQSVANPFYGIITTGPEAAATIPRSYLVAPFPQFTAIYLSFLNGGYEDYNAFQLKLNKRLSHGLTLLVSFTGQKQIDDYSGIENVGNITGGIQNIYNPVTKLNHSPSSPAPDGWSSTRKQAPPGSAATDNAAYRSVFSFRLTTLLSGEDRSRLY